jgi:hypothetical protein
MKDKKIRASENIGDEKMKNKKEEREEEIPVCNYAPEWAEHARFYREDEPCDDSRMGDRPCTNDAEGCPVTDNIPTEDIENI